MEFFKFQDFRKQFIISNSQAFWTDLIYISEHLKKKRKLEKKYKISILQLYNETWHCRVLLQNYRKENKNKTNNSIPEYDTATCCSGLQEKKKKKTTLNYELQQKKKKLALCLHKYWHCACAVSFYCQTIFYDAVSASTTCSCRFHVTRYRTHFNHSGAPLSTHVDWRAGEPHVTEQPCGRENLFYYFDVASLLDAFAARSGEIVVVVPNIRHCYSTCW